MSYTFRNFCMVCKFSRRYVFLESRLPSYPFRSSFFPSFSCSPKCKTVIFWIGRVEYIHICFVNKVSLAHLALLLF